MIQFKAGDWVRVKHSGEVFQINEFHFSGIIAAGNDKYLEERFIEPWQPQEGEWCVFTQSSDDSAIIAQYDKTIKIDHTWDIPHTEVLYKSKESAGLFRYRKIEPFIGQLPSWIKS